MTAFIIYDEENQLKMPSKDLTAKEVGDLLFGQNDIENRPIAVCPDRETALKFAEEFLSKHGFSKKEETMTKPILYVRGVIVEEVEVDMEEVEVKVDLSKTVLDVETVRSIHEVAQLIGSADVFAKPFFY